MSEAQTPGSLDYVPFHLADFKAIAAFRGTMRAFVVAVALTGDHDGIPDSVEVSSPYRSTELHWLIARASDGVWVDDISDGVTRLGPFSMGDALATVEVLVEEDRAEAIAALPG